MNILTYVYMDVFCVKINLNHSSAKCKSVCVCVYARAWSRAWARIHKQENIDYEGRKEKK